jgi:predicted SAM-dependent methyltransferase
MLVEPRFPPMTSDHRPPETKAALRAAPPKDPSKGRARRLAHNVARLAASTTSRRLAATRAAWWRLLARGRLSRAPRPLRLCLGAGGAPLSGWVNVDFEPGCDVRLDLRFALPLPDRSVALIASEHVIEHLALTDGLALLRECRRVLADDGVLRVATPDLAALVRAYQGDWRAQDWVNWPGHEWIDSAARMLNVSFRSWGHLHLYDHDELTRRLAEAGFAATRRCALGESPTPGLAGLETRADSLLVVEAWGRK